MKIIRYAPTGPHMIETDTCARVGMITRSPTGAWMLRLYQQTGDITMGKDRNFFAATPKIEEFGSDVTDIINDDRGLIGMAEYRLALQRLKTP